MHESYPSALKSADPARILDEQGANPGLNALRIFAEVPALGGSLISLAIAKWAVRCMVGARVIGTPRTPGEQWPVAMARRQVEPAGIGLPGVGIDDAPDVNAFATGASRNNALVTVSTGLFDRLRREEVETVLVHDVSHVANGDLVTLAPIQGVVNTFAVQSCSRRADRHAPRG